MVLRAFLVSMLLCGCRGDAQQIFATENKDFRVELLFSHDDCSVYRFMDGDYHYFAKCNGVAVPVTERHCTQNGKTRTCRDE